MSQVKVSYFGVPGRGESVRLMCALAGLEFTDDKFEPKAWAATRKGAARFRMTPTVEGLPGVGENGAGQSRALVRFLGKMAVGEDGATPLYPTDAVDALRADELCDYVEDVWGKLLEARAAKAVAAALAPSTGGVAAMLDVLEHSLPAAGAGGVGGGGGFAVGSATSTADVFLFAALGWWATPFFKGSTLDALLAGRPKLRAVAERVGALPAVRAFYAGRDFKAPQHQLWAVYGHLAKL